jgi:hypothetical protein
VSADHAIDWADLRDLAEEDERLRRPFFWETHTPEEVARARAAALAMPDRAESLREEEEAAALAAERKRSALMLAGLRPALDEHVKDLVRQVMAEDMPALLAELRRAD